MASTMKKIFSMLAAIVFLGLFFSCSEDNTTTPNPDVAQPQFNLVNFFVRVPTALEFEQGQLSEYKIEATVPSGFTSEVTVDNLPEGAVFKDLTLTWQPPCDLGADGKLSRGYTYFEVRFNLKVKEDSRHLYQKTVLLIVNAWPYEDRACGEL